MELSFRPSISFAVTVDVPLISDASVSLTVDLDIPKLNVNITQVHNVTSDCNPVSPFSANSSSSSSSVPSDQIYENLTLIAPSIGFREMEIFNESASFFGVNLGGQQAFDQSEDFNLSTECLFYDAAKKSLTPPTAVKAKVVRSQAVDRRPSFAVAVTMAIMVGCVSW